jgi:hypothetical protein
MSEYRIKSSGEIKSQGEIRKLNPNVSLPRVWNANVMESLGIDPVLASPKPDASGEYKTVVRNGVEQDANGNWVYAWTERDMFSDYTDEDGTVHTKAEQEEAYTARKNEEAAKSVRSQRDSLLAETDFYALTDVTMSAEMATYRQALRDITDQEGFPNDVTFPEKPE